MNRKQHLAWSKARAIEILEDDGIVAAWTSLVSDLNNHEETRGHIAIETGMLLLMGNHWKTNQDCKTFIEGFN